MKVPVKITEDGQFVLSKPEDSMTYIEMEDSPAVRDLLENGEPGTPIVILGPEDEVKGPVKS